MLVPTVVEEPMFADRASDAFECADISEWLSELDKEAACEWSAPFGHAWTRVSEVCVCGEGDRLRG